jgi:hypothetical protein
MTEVSPAKAHESSALRNDIVPGASLVMSGCHVSLHDEPAEKKLY